MSDEIREKLAAYAHETWSGWMKYQFNRSIDDGPDSVPVMSLGDYARWMRQMNTPYAKLPESEKASDRAEADKILAILKEIQP